MSADTFDMARAPRIEKTPTGVSVTMLAPKAVPLVVMLVLWLTIWSFGGIAAIDALINSFGFNLVTFFLLFWLFGWIVGEVLAAWALVFMLNGAEIIAIDGDALTRRAEAFKRGLTWRYPLNTVANLRTTGGDSEATSTFVAFDTKGKTVRFGTDLNPDGAEQIVAALIEAAPSLVPARHPDPTPAPATAPAPAETVGADSATEAGWSPLSS